MLLTTHKDFTNCPLKRKGLHAFVFLQSLHCWSLSETMTTHHVRLYTWEVTLESTEHLQTCYLMLSSQKSRARTEALLYNILSMSTLGGLGACWASRQCPSSINTSPKHVSFSTTQTEFGAQSHFGDGVVHAHLTPNLTEAHLRQGH